MKMNRHRVQTECNHRLVEIAKQRHLMFVFLSDAETDEATECAEKIGIADMLRVLEPLWMKDPKRNVIDTEQEVRDQQIRLWNKSKRKIRKIERDIE